jgi:hypothetical protein
VVREIVLLVVGWIVVIFTSVDALWTTLWVDGHAGPFTRRHNSLTRRMMWLAAGNDSHRLLSVTGPIILVTSVLAWAVLHWIGWVILFSADPRSLEHAHLHTTADLVDRIYYVGYTMFTVGNGDFSPTNGVWQIISDLASLSGLFLLTLSVTYLLAIIEAVVTKRSFGSQVWALGATPEEVLLHSWDGKCFRSIDIQLLSIVEQLNLVTEQHEAYPMLHYYHEAERKESVSANLATFSDALRLFMFGVAAGVRPAPNILHVARYSVNQFLETLETAYIERDVDTPPAPDLAKLRAAGIPTVSDEEFAITLLADDDRRRLLNGFLRSERRLRN